MVKLPKVEHESGHLTRDQLEAIVIELVEAVNGQAAELAKLRKKAAAGEKAAPTEGDGQ